MNKTLPFDPSNKKDWGVEVGSLRTELEKVSIILDKGNEEISAVRLKLVNDAKESTQAKIDQLNKELSAYIEECSLAHTVSATNVREEYNKVAEPLKVKITEADQNSKNQTKISGAVEYVERTKKEIELIEKEALTQSEQIKSLDGLKAEMMQNLPIDNLEVKDGDIYINGVNFDTLNEASKISFCLMVAGLRKTKLPLICVDGLEALDEETFKKFRELAEKTDMQFFVTRVSEDESLTLN